MERREVHDHLFHPPVSSIDVLIVGGGAAGLLAAGRAAELGATTLLIEKTARIGAKLRLAGGGRCNLTNAAPLETFLAAYGPAGLFLRNAYGRFFREELLALLSRLGVPTRTEADGRIFPTSGRSDDVIAALERYLRAGGVTLALNQPAQGLLMAGGAIRGVRLAAGDQPARRVILATGGLSYPHTGSTGDGFAWLTAAGHTVRPLRPALIPLETVEEWPRRLTGIALADAGAAVWAGGQRIASRRGEVLFTHFGLSGPVILNLSGAAVSALAGGTVEISLDLLPALNADEADARWRAELAAHGRQALGTILRSRWPARLSDALLELAGLPADRPGAQVSADERRRLLGRLRDLRLTVRRARPAREAMVTAGGVDLKEVDPRTLESRKVAGLYIVGELLDLAGATGGYNLQMAFSTGYLAGAAAAAK